MVHTSIMNINGMHKMIKGRNKNIDLPSSYRLLPIPIEGQLSIMPTKITRNPSSSSLIVHFLSYPFPIANYPPEMKISSKSMFDNIGSWIPPLVHVAEQPTKFRIKLTETSLTFSFSV